MRSARTYVRVEGGAQNDAWGGGLWSIIAPLLYILGFKNDFASCVTLLELSIGIANLSQRIDLSDRDLEAAGGQQPS
jgi:uncharacterized membrane protein YphA (DoxX/SURF4 family)